MDRQLASAAATRVSVSGGKAALNRGAAAIPLFVCLSRESVYPPYHCYAVILL